MDTSYFDQFGLSQEAVEQIAQTWEISQRSFPKDGVYFLQEEYLADIIAQTGLRAAAVPTFMDNAAKIRNSEALSRLAWHCHWMLHIASNDLKKKGAPYAFEPQGLAFFPAFPVIANMPALRAFYQSRGIPLSILHDSATVLDIWAQDYYEKHNAWGVKCTWINQAFSHNLFRLRRLEFQFGIYDSPFHVFVSSKTGETCAFSPADKAVAADGFFCQPDQPVAFMTTFEDSGSTVTGYPALANGRLANHVITLDCKEWVPLFLPGDAMAHVHIPAIEPLSYEECKAGLEQAREFFPKYFPEFDFKGFMSTSWLFDPTLQNFLPPTSNIVRFQSLFHLHPRINANDWQIRERVFGNPDLPLDKVPQKTSLQRIVKEKILAGHRFRGESCYATRN
ncbi:MAG: hypothetical protein J6X55_10500 [Victivallales bacterium]|nr:hypothetical protein [Victivallales bacterium]